MGIRSMLYLRAKLTGDYQAVKKDKVGRRVAGRATESPTRKLFFKE